MVTSNVRSKRQQQVGVMGVFGKGILVGLFVSASAVTHASPVTGQSVYVDDSCGDSGAGARHGGSRVGCTIVLNEHFSETAASAGSVQATFITPANFSGAVSITTAQLVDAKPTPTPAAVALAPPLVAPGPSVVVNAPIVETPQGVAAPSITLQPPVTGAPMGGDTLPMPTVEVLAVPETVLWPYYWAVLLP